MSKPLWLDVPSTALFCRKTFPGKVRGTADPSATLGMTKERATFVLRVIAERKAFFVAVADPTAEVMKTLRCSNHPL
jgi:hypothetical protein